MKNLSKQIVIVCGYQKSGTTWSTRLVAQLLDCPSLGYWGYDGNTFATEGVERDSTMVCYQSHHLYDDLLADKSKISKIIYVVRDPRDIVVSGIFHFRFYNKLVLKTVNAMPMPGKLKSLIKKINASLNSKKYKIRRMLEMLTQGDDTIDHCQWPWDKHTDSYSNRQNALLVRYEDLLNDGLLTAKKILAFCEKGKSDEQILRDLDAQSFATKRKEFENQKEEIKVRHMRKGVAGDWQRHLDSQEINKIESKFSEQMKRLGYL